MAGFTCVNIIDDYKVVLSSGVVYITPFSTKAIPTWGMNEVYNLKNLIYFSMSTNKHDFMHGTPYMYERNQ